MISRKPERRYPWDRHFAAAASVALMAFLVGACASSSPSSSPSPSSSAPPPVRYPITEQAAPFSALNKANPRVAPNVTASVTSERIVQARSEPHNWLTYYGAYDGQRYSELDQINTTNVRELKPAWVFQQGVIGLVANPATYSFEATPIVVDGVMFVSGWDGYVWALDAVTGELLWEYRHAIPLDVALCCGNVNRGVAPARPRRSPRWW